MDFTGVEEFVLLYETDILTGDLVLTVKDSTETTTIGTVRAEPNKMRSLLEALSEIGKNIPTEQSVVPRKRATVMLKDTQRASTRFA